MKSWLGRHLPPFLWVFLIYLGSSWPAARVSENGFLDLIAHKAAHLFEYGILFILYYRRLSADLWSYQRNKVLQSLLFVLLLGIFDEYHQSLVPGRRSKSEDVLVDLVGGLLAFWLWWFLKQKRQARRENWEKSLPKNSS